MSTKNETVPLLCDGCGATIISADAKMKPSGVLNAIALAPGDGRDMTRLRLVLCRECWWQYVEPLCELQLEANEAAEREEDDE